MRSRQLRTLGLLCALTLVPHARTHAQERPLPAWQVMAGGTAIDFAGDRKLGFGPSLGIRRMVSHRVSLDLAASVLLTNSGSPKFTSAVLGELGPSLVWRGERHDVALSMGLIVGTLWEKQGGGQASTLGIFGGLGGTYWLGSVGLSGRAAYHLWYGDPGASLNLGVAFRW
jgi:hypothetical protein